jgi:hypothetical protein
MWKLRSSTRGATELHLLDAHPTAYTGLACLHCSGTYRITFHITSKAEWFLLRVAYRITVA